MKTSELKKNCYCNDLKCSAVTDIIQISLVSYKKQSLV